MTETSYFWPGEVLGDAVLAPYSDEDYAHLMKVIFQHDPTQAHVFSGIGDDLEVTLISQTSFSVGSGFAIVDGKFYENTVGITSQIEVIEDPDHLGGTEPGPAYFKIVGLQKNSSGKEIRIFVGDNYASSAIALANLWQESGIMWQVPLAVLEIFGGEIISITDYRELLHTTDALGTLIRQGGDNYDWTSFGSTTFDVRSVHRIVGVNTFALGAGDAADAVSITFPESFAGHPGNTIPLIFLSIISADVLALGDHFIYPDNITADGFDANIERVSTAADEPAIVFSWIAIGER
jgi:hypothetical protein